MTEKEAVRIVNGILEVAIAAIDAHREKFRMATDELKQEVDRYRYKASKYTCPCCGADIDTNVLDPDCAGGDYALPAM